MLKKIFLRGLWIMTLVIVMMIVPSIRFLFSAVSLGSAVPNYVTVKHSSLLTIKAFTQEGFMIDTWSIEKLSE